LVRLASELLGIAFALTELTAVVETNAQERHRVATRFPQLVSL
jgi:hypothetical protein